MKNLIAQAVFCENLFTELGITLGNVAEYRINSRANSRWGMCKHSASGNHIIEISDKLLADEVPDNILHDTLIHELIHTVKGCNNHGPNFKRLAKKFNDKYGYNIKTSTTYEEKGIERPKKERIIKHKFVCAHCGQVIEREKESKFTKNYDRYTCGNCGHHFIKVF